MPLLFSYGTLQQEAVQLSTFGRLLKGYLDELVGFEQGLFEVKDPQFVATSGKAHHAIVRFNGRKDSRVPGTVFEVTDGELAQADRYEPVGYQRVSAELASGKQAWVYAASAGPIAYRLTLQEQPSYLHATVTGPRTPENALRFLRETHEACTRLGYAALLVEMNLTGPSLDMGSIFSVISQHSPAAVNMRRIAYVEVSGSPVAAEFGANVAANRGVNIRLFPDVDAAARWLADPSDSR